MCPSCKYGGNSEYRLLSSLSYPIEYLISKYPLRQRSEKSHALRSHVDNSFDLQAGSSVSECECNLPSICSTGW